MSDKQTHLVIWRRDPLTLWQMWDFTSQQEAHNEAMQLAIEGNQVKVFRLERSLEPAQ